MRDLRHLGEDLIDEGIDAIVHLILVFVVVVIEAKLAKVLLYLRLSLRVLSAVVSV